MAKAAGWLVAALVLVAAIGALMWGLGQQRLATDLQAQLNTAQQNNAALKETLSEMGERVDEATQEIAALEERVENLAPAVEDETAALLAPDGEAGAALQAFMKSLQGSAKENEDITDNPIMAMFSGEKGKDMARMSAQFSVPAMYGRLFKQLNLPPETEARVREILVDSMANQVAASFDAMNNKADPEEIRKNMEAHGQKLRDELATVLTEEELAVFDEYEANKGRRMLESSLDMQLSMFAGGLTEENQTMFRDVIVEEMLAEGVGIDDPENYTNPGSVMDRQAAAFQRARDRVVPVVDEGQAAHIDAFVQQMAGMMETQRQFIESFMGSNDAQEETPEGEQTAE
jgi:hypothetical protein